MMKEEIKKRIWNYCKSILVVIFLALLLAHGPCGGWVMGMMIALFLGFIFTATIWLLDFKWYWNLLWALFIAPISILLSVLMSKKLAFTMENDLQSLANETLFDIILALIMLSIFVFFIELVNYLGKHIVSMKSK